MNFPLNSAISIPRVSVTGEELPTTRHISGRHHRDMVSDIIVHSVLSINY